jgi:hypothetical protein
LVKGKPKENRKNGRFLISGNPRGLPSPPKPLSAPVPPSPGTATAELCCFRLGVAGPVYQLGLAVNRYYRPTYPYYRSHPEPYPPERLSWPNPSLPRVLLSESGLSNTNPAKNRWKELVIRPDYRFTASFCRFAASARGRDHWLRFLDLKTGKPVPPLGLPAIRPDLSTVGFDLPFSL